MNSNIFYTLLLSKNPVITEVAFYINKTCVNLFGTFFLAGALLEYFSAHEYKALILRSLLSFFVIVNFNSYLDKGIENAFSFSEQILKKFDKNNPLVQSIIKSDITSRKKFMKNRLNRLKKKTPELWDKFLVIVQVLFDDPLTTVLFVFTFFCFLLLQNIYSIIYSLLYIFVTVMALLSVIGYFQKSLTGAIKTSLMLFLTPPVMAIIFILMGGHASYITSPSSNLIQSLEGLMQLLITSIMLLFSPIFANAIVSGGLSKVGGKIAAMGAAAVLPLGLKSIDTIARKVIKKPIDIFKSAGKASTNFGKKLIQSGTNKAKDRIHKKADQLKNKDTFYPNKSYKNSSLYTDNLSRNRPIGKDNSNFEKAVLWSDKAIKKYDKKRIISQNQKSKNNSNSEQNFARFNIPNPNHKNVQKIISELNSGKNNLSSYPKKDLKKALTLAKASNLKTDKTWIKDKRLYWLLHQVSKDSEQDRATHPNKKLKRKTRRNYRGSKS